MKYFVTGATGFVGGRVAQQLGAAGHEVLALVLNPAQPTHLKELGIQLAPGDVTNKESMRDPMSGCDAVFHIAGWYKIGVKDSSPGVQINLNGTRNVLELMQELQIKKGVYTSTLAVNSNTHGAIRDESYHFRGEHVSEYDRTKALAHDIALQFIAQGLGLIIVQPGLVYGPGDQGPAHDFLRQYLTRRLPVVPQKVAYSWAHVEDVARGHIQAMQQGRSGESYFLAGPVHTLIEALHMAQQITGVPLPAFTAPPLILHTMSKIMGMLERAVPVPETYSSEYLRLSAGVTYLGNSAKARHELGWSARPLMEGLTETLIYEMHRLGMKKAG